MKTKKKENNIVVFIKDVLFFVIAYLVITSFIFASSQVNQTSMINTLHDGERLIELKASFLFTDPQRGEIVIFAKTPYKKNPFSMIYESVKYLIESRTKSYTNIRLIKRVIGVPGDIIDIKDGFVFIDGEKMIEPYIKGITTTLNNSIDFPVELKDDEYFLLGDNRQGSHDSRAKDIGLVSKKGQIEGKVILRYWPFNKFGKVE